MFLNKEEAETY